MRLRTHVAFSFAVSYALLRLLMAGMEAAAVNSVIASLLVNYIIDVGHGRRGRYRVRVFVTHSPVGTWTAFVPLTLYAFAVYFGISMPVSPVGLAVAGLTAYVTHMLLDSLTEGGIYLTPRRRVALAHYSYDGLADTATFLLASVLAVMAVGVDVLARPDSLIKAFTEVLSG